MSERLSDSWSEWVIENIVRGASQEDVVDELCNNQGLKRNVAEKKVSELITRSMRELFLAQRQSQVIARLHNKNESTATHIERRSKLSVEDFYASYYSTNTPVVLEDFTADWPARNWTPDRLVELVGSETEVRFTDDRESDPDYDMKSAEHTRHTTMGAFKERVVKAGATNDFYLVANNRNLEQESLAQVFSDLRLDNTMINAEELVGASALWFGPEGTVTPLHHDTSNIMFCQLYGEKLFRLYSPWQTDLLTDARAMYAGIDPENKDHKHRFDALNERRVLLNPGETLFIPVGWWHHVRALSVAISIAFNCFTKFNQFDWYRPREAVLGRR